MGSIYSTGLLYPLQDSIRVGSVWILLWDVREGKMAELEVKGVRRASVPAAPVWSIVYL